MKNKLFIYGTLADPKIQKEVWGRKIAGVCDILSGYKISEIEIDSEIYPLIIPSEAGKVDGLVIEVTDSELGKIDEYETSVYKRKRILLQSGTTAWVYIKG